MKNYLLYLKDIFNAIESIEDFVKELSFQDFKNDDKTVALDKLFHSY